MIMKLKIISFVIPLLVFVVGFIFTFILNTSKSKLNDKSDFNSQQEIDYKRSSRTKKRSHRSLIIIKKMN